MDDLDIRHAAMTEAASDPGTARWSRVRANTASGQIVTQIREALFNGELMPGDVLGSEKDLAAQFGVSRITIRDALRTLEATGIVDIKVGAGGGARIAAGNPDQFADALAIQLKLIGVNEREMIDAQLGVEVMAAKIAAERATDADVARLRGLLRDAEALADDPVEFTRASLDFHLGVVETSQNRALVAQFRALQHLIWGAYLPNTTPTVAKRVLKGHRRLLAAIEKRDAMSARDIMTSYLEGLRDRAFHGQGRTRRNGGGRKP